MKLTSWGNHPVVDDATLIKPFSPDDAQKKAQSQGKQFIGRGLGRAYGDSALNKCVMQSGHLNRMLAFDEDTGVLAAESGVSLAEILDVFVPRGWFLPVTPGTKFVSLGGAVASDVHGKNHHVDASFCEHVLWLDLWSPALGVVRCSPQEHEDLFWATAGGMGLTGFILRVAIKLVRIPSAFIKQDLIKAGSLDHIMETFEEYEDKLPFSVAWIDCLKAGKAQGRSIFMGGRFAEPDELPKKYQKDPLKLPRKLKLDVPFNFPSFALNTYSVKLFNALYYGKARKGLTQNVVDYDTFFYPLDAILNWNRIYGTNGFTQYQFVIPKDDAEKGLRRILTEISDSGQGSFLTVLKLFGRQPVHPNNISFPMQGYTLALDFKINKSLFPLLDRLDALVMEYGGHNYLPKDCRLSKQTFRRGYGGRVDDFLKIKAQSDPQCRLGSLQSKRIGLSE